MLNKGILLLLCGLSLLDLVKTEPTDAVFNMGFKNGIKLLCDEDYSKINENKYTVLEDDYLNLFINFTKTINRITCLSLNNNKTLFEFDFGAKTTNNSIKINITKEMGGKWRCKFLTLKSISGLEPVSSFNGSKYIVAYCYMQIQVRMKENPIRVMVNNIQLQTHRINITKENIDYTAIYEYGDDDTIQIICQAINQTILVKSRITMEYDFGNRINSLFNTSTLSSLFEIGFRSKFNYAEDGKIMTCVYENNFKSITQIKFVYRKQFKNLIGVKINDLSLRPTDLKPSSVPFYVVTYEYVNNKTILLECEVYGDLHVSMLNGTTPGLEDQVIGNENGKRINKTLMLKGNEKVRCAADKINGGSAEEVEINFIPKNESNVLVISQLDAFVPNLKSFLELYESDRKIIFYEYHNDMDINLNCSVTLLKEKGFVVYVKFLDQNKTSVERTEETKQLKLRHEADNSFNLSCYLNILPPNKQYTQNDKILKELTVYFTKAIQKENLPTRVATATSVALQGNPNSTDGLGPKSNDKAIDSWVFVVLGSTTCIIIICISTIIFQMKKGRRSERGPNNPTYVNMDGTSQASLPVCPTQWAENYAVPADVRQDNATYCVPYRPEQTVYSVPIPKSERKKKQDKEETNHTYTNVKNTVKKQLNHNSDEPNYAEVGHPKIGPCYAKVLPKSQRNREEVSPYSYVTSVPNFDISDSNRSGQEPMYCEPQINK